MGEIMTGGVEGEDAERSGGGGLQVRKPLKLGSPLGSQSKLPRYQGGISRSEVSKSISLDSYYSCVKKKGNAL